MHKMTIHEIAAKAKVSVATVSRAIHSPHLLKPDTLSRIQEIMAYSGYSYNAAAANLSKGISQSVAIIVPRIDSPVFSDTITGAQECLYSRGYHATVAGTQYSAEGERELLQKIMEQRPAGILLAGYSQDNEARVLSLAREVPLVIMWEKAIAPLNYVGFDNYQTTYGILEYLASLGHRRIAAILGPYTKIVRAQQRYHAYLDFLKNRNMPFHADFLCEGEPTLADGHRAMEQLLGLTVRPTAVFCNNDLQAIAAIRVIHDAGLRVPEDISICGFDDAAVSPYITPPLTTMHVPCREIGMKAAQCLHDLISRKSLGPVCHTIETFFVERQSCMALPHSGQ